MMETFELSNGVQTPQGPFTTLVTTHGRQNAESLAQYVAAQNGETVHVWHRVATTLVQLVATAESDGSIRPAGWGY